MTTRPSDLAVATEVVADEFGVPKDSLTAAMVLSLNRIGNVTSRLTARLNRRIVRPDKPTSVGDFLKQFVSERDVAIAVIARYRGLRSDQVTDDLRLGNEILDIATELAGRLGKSFSFPQAVTVGEFLEGAGIK